MDPKSKDFQKLQAKWYSKLKREGFEDIEYGEDSIKRCVPDAVSRTTRNDYEDMLVTYQSREEYYRLAGQFFYEHAFDNRKEQLIWELHKDGISMRDIVQHMKSRNFKVQRDFVHKTIKRLSEKMLRKINGQE